MTQLTDPFGRTHTYLRISVTDRCNLNCMYCMPPADPSVGSVVSGHDVPRPEARSSGSPSLPMRTREARLLTYEEIVRIARVFTGLGITKIRLTGGEPLVRKGIVSLVATLSQLDGLERLCMTTNGVLLSTKAVALRQAGLTGLNVSLDSLRPERFERIAMKPSYSSVLRGIDAAFDAGFPSIKLNVVVMGGVNDDELPDFVMLARDRAIDVRFIEYMPFRYNRWKSASFVSWHEMRRRIEAVHDWSAAMVHRDAGGVAREFRMPGWKGTVGFITSMSDHFCDSCNRLRLTADGSVKSCLFHPAEVNLRSALRAGAGGDELARLIRASVLQKPAAHAPVEQLIAAENRSMIEIGG